MKKITAILLLFIASLSSLFPLLDISFISKINAAPICTTNDVGGFVFRDFNFNGVYEDTLQAGMRDATATGVANNADTANPYGALLEKQNIVNLSGIKIEAYNNAGSMVASTTTSSYGDWIFTNIASQLPLRIEVSNLPIGYTFGHRFNPYNVSTNTINSNNNNQSFIVTSSGCSNETPIVQPANYVQANPVIAVANTQNNRADNEGVNFLNYQLTNKTGLPDANSTSGTNHTSLAFNKVKKELYVASNGDQINPSWGLGTLGACGVYKIPYPNTAVLMTNAVETPYFNLCSLTGPFGPILTNDPATSNGLSSSGGIQKYEQGIGGMFVTEDGNTLYLVNIGDKTLYQLDISGGGTPIVTKGWRYPTSNAACATDDKNYMIPWALKYDNLNKKIYTGVTCIRDKVGLVYSIDTNVAASGTTINNLEYSFNGTGISNEFNSTYGTGVIGRVTVSSTLIITDIDFTDDSIFVTTAQPGMAGESASTGVTVKWNRSTGTYSLAGIGSHDALAANAVFSVHNNKYNTSSGGLASIPGTNTLNFSSNGWGGENNSGGSVKRYSQATNTDILTKYRINNFGHQGSGLEKGNSLGDIEILSDPAPVEIGNKVWLDENQNGIQDPSEKGISGVTVNLYDAAGTTLLNTTITDANGEWNFGNLAINTAYVVKLNNPADYTDSTKLKNKEITELNTGIGNNPKYNDSDAKLPLAGSMSATNAPIINVSTGTAGDTRYTFDFGLISKGVSLGNQIFYDRDENGIYDASIDRPVSGVVLKLYIDTDSSGNLTPADQQAIDLDGNAVANITTGLDGKYLFSSLPDNVYIVSVEDTSANLNGFINTISEPNADTDINNDNNGDVTTSVTGSLFSSNNIIVVSSSEPTNDGDTSNNTNLSLDFGFIPTAKVSVGDLVFYDKNRNGVFDSSTETGVNNAQLELYEDINNNGNYDAGTDTLINTTTTDINGNYKFTNLWPGNYIVLVIKNSDLAGYQSTSPDVLTDNNTENDDNGINSATYVESRSFNLSVGDEIDGIYNPSIDFGFIKGEIGNQVWLDTNSNGVFDTGEAGIPYVQIDLYKDNGDGVFNSATDTIVRSAETDVDGKYSFVDVDLDGVYYPVVKQSTLPTGSSHTTGTANTNNNSQIDNGYKVTLNTATPTNYTADFGYFIPTMSLGNVLFFDRNENGLYESATDRPIPNISLRLFLDVNNDGMLDSSDTQATDMSGVLVPDQITNSTGNYLFTNLKEGNYIVSILNTTALDEYKATTYGSDPDNNTNNDSNAKSTTANSSIYASDAITLVPNTEPNNDGDTNINTNLTVDFGFIPTAKVSVGDLVFYDKNRNGVFDSSTETGVNNAQLELYEDINNNGNYDAGTDTLINTTTTDINGNYKFTNLWPGNYIVLVIKNSDLAGYQSTSPDVLADNNVEDDDNGLEFPTLITSKVFNLSPNKEIQTDYNPTIDFGLIKAELGNQVWLDTNKNGVFDTAESGLENVKVNLYKDNGDNTLDIVTDTLIGTATTSATGTYYFGDLDINNKYFVVIDQTSLPAGAMHTTGTANTNNNSQDDLGYAITLTTASPSNLTGDFGYYGTFKISGFVYVDKNENTSKESTDTPLPNTVIELYNKSGILVASTITDNTGYYEFKELLPGDYKIKEIQPVLYGSKQAPSNEIAVKLVDKDLTDNNFGEIYSSISGYVYYDKANNGIKDAEDKAIPGVTIKLSGKDAKDNDVSLTTTTDNTGYYEFKDLYAGVYTIEEVQPINYNDGKDSVGQSGGVINPDKFNTINLLGGVKSQSYNFGEIENFVLADTGAENIIWKFFYDLVK